MRILLTLGIVCILEAGFSQNASLLNLMPVPSGILIKKDVIRIKDPLRISITGKPDDRLFAAANRFKKRICERAGICSDQDPILNSVDTLNSTWLKIRVDRPGKLEIGEEESYRLESNGDQVYVHAPTDLGAMHALETILQLISADSVGYYIPGVEINDSPRFSWRGLLIDISKEGITVEQIQRNLDGMATVKMNVLQLRLSADQVFNADSNFLSTLNTGRAELKSFSRDEIRSIVWYAGQLGIRVVPSLELPDFKEGAAYHALDSLVADMAALFPDDFVQIRSCQTSSMEEQAAVIRILEMLRKNGKKPISSDAHDPFLLESYDIGKLQSAAVYYLQDPLPSDFWLKNDENSRVLGGQAEMFVKPESSRCLDSRIWPRTAAIAERLWSPREVSDVNNMYRRLDNISLQLEGLGLHHLSYRSALLRQLANGADPGPLQILADVIEPLQWDESNCMINFRLSEVACPDPILPRHFNQLVDSFLVTRSSDAGKRIQALLADWEKNDAALQELIKRSPVLKDASRFSESLSAIAHAGQEALAFLRQHDRADRDWLRKQLELLDRAARPGVGCTLGVVVPIKKLVSAAGAGRDQSNMEPSVILTSIMIQLTGITDIDAI